MHTQREHARWLVEEKKAGYVFVVKRNQPRLYRQVKALPWKKIPALDATRDRGHGRYDVRALQAVTCLGALALDFPYAVQALRIRRRRYNAATDRWSTVTVYAITNLPACWSVRSGRTPGNYVSVDNPTNRPFSTATMVSAAEHGQIAR